LEGEILRTDTRKLDTFAKLDYYNIYVCEPEYYGEVLSSL